MKKYLIVFILTISVITIGYFLIQYLNNHKEGVIIKELVIGHGAEAIAGKSIVVHYVGKLTDGKEFDSSLKRNKPFEFKLGHGSVIKGWDIGVVGMKVGGKRQITIPPHLGYGDQGVPRLIPPDSTLIFEIELLQVN